MLTRSSDGTWSAPARVYCNIDYESRVLKILRDALGQLHALWGETIRSVTNYQLYYAPLSTSPAWETSIRQTVTIPADMKDPTLSLLYHASPSFGPGAEFKILVNGEQVPLNDGKQSEPESGDPSWTHGWVDMAPYAMQTVEISFVANSTFASGDITLRLDEVSLGSWLQIYQTFIPTILR